MFRSTPRRFWVVLILCASAFGRQAVVRETTLESKHVAGSIHVLEKTRSLNHRGKIVEWSGNVCASVGLDGILLVDNGIPEVAEALRSALRQISARPLRTIINTHWHPDHTGANHLLGSGVVIIAHEDTRKQMMEERGVSDDSVMSSAPEEALPNMTFRDSLSIYFNGEEIRIFHFPHGHTSGDIVVWFTGSNVITMGDTYNGRHFPRLYGDVEIYAKQYEALIKRLPQDVIVISGHRPTAVLDDLKEYHRMLEASIEAVRESIVEGIQIDEIDGERLLSEWGSWGLKNTFNALSTEEWIENVHHTLFKR